MFKLIYRGIIANLGRLVLTLVSVVLGVAFVSGSFILADSLRAVFNQISEDAFAGVDAQVRAIQGELSSDEAPPRFDDGIIEAIAATPGVDYAEGGLFAFEQTYSLGADGEPVRPTGPPVFTVSWGGPSPVSSFTIIEGEAPVGQQVALDRAQVEAGDFTLGDEVIIAFPTGDPEPFELSAVIDFGEGGTGGAYFLLYDLATTQRLIGAEGVVDSVVVNGGDTPGDELLAAIAPVLPDNLEVVPGETVEQEQKDSFGSFINVFGNVLLGFAVVVLFVSTFIIYNTFAILVGQRTRQLGLLRSIGASSTQIRLMVLIESVIIGLFASIIGLFGGLGVAAALKWLFSLGGGEFPSGPLQILPRTIVVVVAVGLLVTVGSALIPAIRASRVSPLEAVRDGGRKERSLRFRLYTAALVLIPGLALLLLGMFASIESTRSRLVLIGAGAALTFIGVSMASVLFAGPVARLLGLPIARTRGVNGRIARDNASRNPQRTAATATALMIGLALITGVSVLTTSLLATFDDLLADSVAADAFVFEDSQQLPFSPSVVDAIGSLAEVDQVSGFGSARVKVDDDVVDAAFYDSQTGTRVVNPKVSSGDITDLGVDGVAILDDEADKRGLAVGDTVQLELEDGFTGEVTVKAIFDEARLTESSWLFDRQLISPHVSSDQISFVGVVFTENTELEAGKAAVERALEPFPQLVVQDNSEFQEQMQAQIKQLQYLVWGLLVLCLVVAFFGIVNTMALSVLERIREIGLLRAVGMTRGQLKSSVRWEAIIVSVFGSVLGVLMGLLLGSAAVIAIPDSFISRIGIPWIPMAIFVLVGAVIGVIAAFFPASRAARLNVLDAISHE